MRKPAQNLPLFDIDTIRTHNVSMGDTLMTNPSTSEEFLVFTRSS